MKRGASILILMIIYIISGARSCTNDADFQQMKEEKLLSASLDSIKKAFDIASPNDQLLRGYETTAIQKLIDFNDYLEIASDSSVDPTFRCQALQMASNLFIRGKAETGNWIKAFPGTKVKAMEELSEKAFSYRLNCTVKPDQINIKEPLTFKNDSTFTGTLSFYHECEPIKKANPKDDFSGRLLIDIYVLKVLKTFGAECFSVWEVYLGDFNQNP